MAHAEAQRSPRIRAGPFLRTLVFRPRGAAILRMKTQLPIEVMRAIEKKRLTPRQLEKVLDVPQPWVSELLNGKISRMTADFW